MPWVISWETMSFSSEPKTQVSLHVSVGVRLGRTITHWGGPGPQVHPHTTRSTVSWGTKIGVVVTRTVLHGNRDTVIATASGLDIRLLEVEGLLGEAVLVGDVVYGVHDVEGVDNRSVLLGEGQGVGANL
jgi:hypothetical protein